MKIDKNSAFAIFCYRDFIENGWIAKLSTRVKEGIYSCLFSNVSNQILNKTVVHIRHRYTCKINSAECKTQKYPSTSQLYCSVLANFCKLFNICVNPWPLDFISKSWLYWYDVGMSFLRNRVTVVEKQFTYLVVPTFKSNTLRPVLANIA